MTPPLAPSGLQSLAAFCALHGTPRALEALAHGQPAPADPVAALATALAARRSPPALGRPTAEGQAPLARLLRRYARRARSGVAPMAPCADGAALGAALADASPAAQRCLVANAPVAAVQALWASR